MREIKFRAKSTDDGRWVYGYYQRHIDEGAQAVYVEHVIHPFSSYERTEHVDGETVGEFTGLKDNNGKEIYEGDIVEETQYNPSKMKVEFIEGGFCMTHRDFDGYPIDIAHFYHSKGPKIEIIGNIYENGELLK